MARNFIVIDTEAVDTMATARNDGQAHGETSLVYDAGYVIANDVDGVVDAHSFIITDTFFNHSGLMKSAYYADKLPKYEELIGVEWTPISFLDFWKQFCNDAKAYDVHNVWAFNARYDMQALNYTIRTYSNGFRRFFMPYKIQWRDVWDYAGSTVCATKKYVNYCRDNGFVSKKGNPRTNADTVGKYLRNSLEYEEQHTAMSDAIDELRILQTAKKRHQKARKSIGQGWRDASKIAKNM